jgi:hypothetical protein
MKKSVLLLVLAVVGLVFHGCSEVPTATSGEMRPMAPSFDKVGQYDRLSNPTITAPTHNQEISAATTTVTWTASAVPTAGTGHFALDKYAVTLAKGDVVLGTEFALNTATSYELSGLCTGDYKVTIQALAGMTPQYEPHPDLNGHDSQPQNRSFKISGIACEPPPSNIPPVLDVIGNKEINEGSQLTFTATASDADGHTLTFSLVNAPSGASIDAVTGAFTWTPDDGPAVVAFTVKVTDSGTPALSDEEEITVTVHNVAPTATFNYPGSGVNEGQDINLSLTTPNDPSAADRAAGFEYAFDCGSGYGAWAGSNSASCVTTNIGSRSVGAKIRDKDGGTTEYTGTVAINDVVPSITSVTPSVTLLQVGATARVTVEFDGYSGDTFTGTIYCDGSTVSSSGVVTLPSFAHDCSYGQPGVYTVKATIDDEDNVVAGTPDDTKLYQYVVVYDPTAGFVTGGGWINYAADACPGLCQVDGRGDFGFVARYQRGATVPTGNTRFEFHAGNLRFESTSYEWLVVSGETRAQFKGVGTINGAGNFGFLLTAIDGDNFNQKRADRFRIKIWDRDDADNVVFDNQWGLNETGDDATALDKVNGNGSIVIHVPRR